MLTRFDFYPYHDRATDHLKSRAQRNESSACWADMGLGKTCIGLTAIRDLGVPALISAPLRVARDVWPDEVHQWSHLQHLKVVPIIGTPKQRLAALNTKADVHTINRENLAWLRAFFLEQVGEYKWRQIRKWPWPIVGLDESQSYKSQSTTRHKVIWQFRQFFKPVIIELTGTPAPNGYGDVWGQLRLIDGGERLGRTEDAYQTRWFDPPPMGGYGWTLKEHAAKEIQAKIADVVISMRTEDHLSLPPVVYNSIKVRLPDDVLRAYKRFERQAVLNLNGHTITGVNAGALHQKLLQAANGAIYTDEDRNYEVFHREKVGALLEILESLSEPVAIGYIFRHDFEIISEALNALCGKNKIWRVLKSAESMKEFESGLVSYGLLHPASAGHGLNSVYRSGAENLVWYGLTPDLELYEQLNGRLIGGHRRTGRNVVIHHLIAKDTHDEAMLQLLTDKSVTQIDLARSLVRAL